MALKDYTTKKTPEQSIMEIQSIVKNFGVQGVITDYDDTGNIVSMSFKLLVNGNTVVFCLPTDWRPVLTAMENDKDISQSYCHEEQARKTAWRQVFHWIQAQCALVRVNMVKMETIFLPYAVNQKTGKTLAEMFEEEPDQLFLT